MADLLFIYGTLLNDDNEFAIYLKNNSSFYAEGKIKGKLYDLGEYPGAVLTTDTNGYIYGSILMLNDPEGAIEIIDNYEGYDEGQEQPNLFVRVLAEVFTEQGRVNCWVYEYNLPIKGLPLIEGGRYGVKKGDKSRA